jgi:hypothetical protein
VQEIQRHPADLLAILVCHKNGEVTASLFGTLLRQASCNRFSNIQRMNVVRQLGHPRRSLFWNPPDRNDSAARSTRRVFSQEHPLTRLRSGTVAAVTSSHVRKPLGPRNIAEAEFESGANRCWKSCACLPKWAR